MATAERVYRRDNAGSFTTTGGSLADTVPGFPEWRGFGLSELHRRSLRVATTDGQFGNFGTRSPRAGDDNSYRWRWTWRFQIPGSEHGSTRQVVSAAADIVVSAADEIPGQLQLTLSTKDIQKSVSLFCGTTLPDILTRTERPTPEGGRSKSQTRIAGSTIHFV